MGARLHDTILGALLALRSRELAQDIWMVARLKGHPLLQGVAPSGVTVFIPDLHLISLKAEKVYNFSFRQLRQGKPVQRDRLLLELLNGLKDLRTKPPAPIPLSVVQLGDYLDVWRERSISSAKLKTLVNGILKDNGAIHSALSGLGTQFVAGNHDLDLKDLWPETVTATRHVGDPGEASLLALHGDVFDDLEMLFRGRQEWLVAAFGPLAHATPRHLDVSTSSGKFRTRTALNKPPVRIRKVSDANDAPKLVNVWETRFSHDDDYWRQSLNDGHHLGYQAFRMFYPLRTGRISGGYEDRLRHVNAIPGQTAYPGLRGFVVGHTHSPAIRIHQHMRKGKPDADRSFALFDCGAWVEWSQLEPGEKPVPSCHIGVLAGSEFRIYQITPHSSLLG